MPASAPTLGLALIARDEESSLPHLLRSVEGAFDQVALLDTGSEDDTVRVFEDWAEMQDLPLGYRVDHFVWRDDFAAARNAADDLLETDWRAWADADDEIVGASELRGAIGEAPLEVETIGAMYRAPSQELPRQRLTRPSAPAWKGRIHEGRPLPIGPTVVLPPAVAFWQTSRRGVRRTSCERNARILRKWIEAEPDNPRPLGMLAAQEYMEGDLQLGISLFAQHLDRRRPSLGRTQLALCSWALSMLTVVAQEDKILGGPHISILLGRPPEAWYSACVEPLDA